MMVTQQTDLPESVGSAARASVEVRCAPLNILATYKIHFLILRLLHSAQTHYLD